MPVLNAESWRVGEGRTLESGRYGNDFSHASLAVLLRSFARNTVMIYLNDDRTMEIAVWVCAVRPLVFTPVPYTLA
jgi:hypothetical protein